LIKDVTHVHIYTKMNTTLLFFFFHYYDMYTIMKR